MWLISDWQNDIQKILNTFRIKRIRVLQVQLVMQVLILTLELNNLGEMIWNVLLMCGFIFWREFCHGKTCEQWTRRKSMRKLWKRRLVYLLICYVKVYQVNSLPIWHMWETWDLKISLIICIWEICSKICSSKVDLSLIISIIGWLLQKLRIVTKKRWRTKWKRELKKRKFNQQFMGRKIKFQVKMWKIQDRLRSQAL